MKTEEKYLRMTFNERFSISVLLTSFMVLVFGICIEVSEAFWVKWTAAIVGKNAFEARELYTE